ncbi:MAG: ferrochelatase [Blastocatellia bacterium]|nr:ferrochelatase [Blastocatellia bacterium]
MKKVGLLLINLGSPAAPTPAAVGAYLREFLMDEKVIDVPAALRWLLVHGVIVPRRKHQSAGLYRNIWMVDEGAPLLFHTRALAEALRPRLRDSYVVEIGMRYGRPSIAEGMSKLLAADVARILAVPLYPQYAESSYETAAIAARAAAGEQGCADRLAFLPPFYDRPEFIAACAIRVREHRTEFAPDHLVFSYHSLPERHIRRLDATRRHCLRRADCCEEIRDVNRSCYRAHCVATTRAIARELGLSQEAYSLSFQSRLGRAAWLGPQTEDLLRELAARGIRRVSVACPSFTADCLETLEEIGERARRVFLDAGGHELRLVPALNDHPAWVEALALFLLNT